MLISQRCSGEKPVCSMCIKYKKECEYVAPPRKPGKRKAKGGHAVRPQLTGSPLRRPIPSRYQQLSPVSQQLCPSVTPYQRRARLIYYPGDDVDPTRACTFSPAPWVQPGHEVL